MHTRSLAVLLLATAIATLSASLPAVAQNADISAELRERVRAEGRVRAIVELRTGRAQRAEGRLSRAGAAEQRRRIRDVGERVANRLQARDNRVLRRFETVPFVAVEVDAATLDALGLDGDVAAVVEDPLLEPSLAESVPHMQADLAHGLGLDGTGTAVAILDTGVDSSHPFLAGKVVEEACYASGEAYLDPGDCPDGTSAQTGAGAGVPCGYLYCDHGTHVAGIAAGSGPDFTGVAPGAGLIAVQVFHATNFCAEPPCAVAYGSDITAGLERVYELRDSYNIAAANLSLGGSVVYGTCDGYLPSMDAVIQNLRSAGIATVIASGNNGATAGISFPSCISAAISIGATDDTDLVASFSNVSSDLDLFAPGVSIDSSIPGGGFANFNGTSMATPHAAGAFAILRQSNPSASVDELLTTLSDTGRLVYDHRGGAYPVVKPRIRMSGAVGISSPTPFISTVSPDTLPAWSAASTLTVSGSGFVPGSYALVGGQVRQTLYVDDTSLVVTMLDADLATAATSLAVNIVNPPPGGGSSAAAVITVTPPVFSFSNETPAAGEVVTVSWSDGPTATGAWVSLAQVGASEQSYLAYHYLHSLPVPKSWDVQMPAAGDYEIRLYAGPGYERVATSQTVTVGSGGPPPGSAELSVSATEVAAGEALTVSLVDGPGGAGDWLAFADVGAPDAAYLQWTYVGAGNTSFDWTISAPGTAGQYEFRLFENGGYTRLATSEAVTVTIPPAPALDMSVSATEVGPLDQVTLSISGAPGGAADWVSLASTAMPDTTYLLWSYVGAGNTNFDWTVAMPATPGDYEFRFYRDGNYTVVARSVVVTVTDTPPEPGGDIELTVDVTSVEPGEPITVTLTGSPGGAYDWLAFAATGTPGTSYLSYKYVGSGVTTTTWTVTAPSTTGDYEFRLLLDNGYEIAATSPVVSVEFLEPPEPAVLTVDKTTAAPAETVTVSVTNGYGGSGDWIALAEVGAPETYYLNWTYVDAGASEFDWSVSMPSTVGDYEFRLYRDFGYTRAATSPTVSVQ